MKYEELIHVLIAIVVLSLVIGFEAIVELNGSAFGIAILAAFLIIFVHVVAKILMAGSLDAGVEHSIWHWSRYGFKPNWHLKKEIPLGIIIPFLFTILSFGVLKVVTILTYETRALKRRAARRFGHYSFTEMTDWHNSLVGAAGIIGILLLSLLSFILSIWSTPFEFVSKMAAFYAFYNMIPFSKLDGTQIFFGSRVTWVVLAIITLIFASYSLFL